MTVELIVMGDENESFLLCNSFAWMRCLKYISMADNLPTLNSLNLIDGYLEPEDYEPVKKELEKAMDIQGVDAGILLKFSKLIDYAIEKKADYIAIA